MHDDAVPLSDPAPQPRNPRPDQSHRVAARLSVLVYGIWLLLLPLTTGESRDRFVQEASAPATVALECCRRDVHEEQLRIGRRRTLLRALSTMAGMRDGGS